MLCPDGDLLFPSEPFFANYSGKSFYQLRAAHVPHYSVHAESAVEGTEYNIVAEWSGSRVDHVSTKKKISGGTRGLFDADAAMYLDRMTLRKGRACLSAG